MNPMNSLERSMIYSADILAPAASRHRVTDERSREGASPPYGSVPTGAPASNDVEPVRTQFGDHCRKRDAIQAVRDRMYAEWMRIAAEMQAEIDRIQRS